MSIRNSMYRMVFAFIIFPFIIFCLCATQIYSSKLEKVLDESLSAVANAQVREMTAFCEQQNDYLVFIGTMEMSRAAMAGTLDQNMMQYLNNTLYTQVQTMKSINSLSIINPNFRVVASSEEHNIFADKGFETLIQNMGDESFYISNILTDEKNQKTLVAIARIEDKGTLLGYIVEEIPLDFYENICKQAELWNDATFYLIDTHHQIITADTPNQNRDSFVTTLEEREDYNQKFKALDFAKHPHGRFQFKMGTNRYITYYSDLKYTDWCVLLTLNLSDYRAQKVVYLILVFFTILPCTILARWISWFASQRIVHPIKAISNTLSAIQHEQDYSLRIKVARKDELGILATEINELINFIETENLYQAQQQRLLQEKAEQDALTKVLNKEHINQYFQDALDRHRVNGEAMAVLFVDIDNFKAFNTNYGHSVGDQVLLFLASALAHQTGGTVGRVGGDEFLVIIEDCTDLQALDACLTQLKISTDSRFVVRGSGAGLPISCSIGAIYIDFAHSDTEPVTLEQLTDMADSVMYQVKNNGKSGHLILEYNKEERKRRNESGNGE